jgi:hypothetical protein
MPLSINVGLSRKSSRDYQSQGQSINVTAELDQSLLARPAELQDQIAALYEQAQQALDNAASDTTQLPKPVANGQVSSSPHNGHRAHTTQPNSRHNGNRHTSRMAGGPPLTASQQRAIFAIAGRLGLDADEVCGDEVGCKVDQLTIGQASQLIDLLKSLDAPPATVGKVGAR